MTGATVTTRRSSQRPQANRRGRVEGLPRVFCVIRLFSFLRLDSSALGELAGLLRLQHCPPAYIRRTSRPHS
jgi:hypothetical protein